MRRLPVGACLAVLASAAMAAAPVVDDFRASAYVVAPGTVVTLTVDAHDPDCPDSCTTGCGLYIRSDLTTWSATGGTFPSEDNGTSASPYTATADWQAPDTEGVYTIEVYLADSGTFLCGGRGSTTPSLDIQVTTTPNEPPVIDSLVADPTQLFPEDTSALTCAATDPEGDPVAYSWSADSGTVEPGAGGTATFTPDRPGIANVTCTATDPAGAASRRTVSITVTDAVAEKWIDSGLVAPQRVAIDSRGSVYVVDRAGGGLAVINLFTGAPVYRLALPRATSVAVDWNDDLVVGGPEGAEVLTRRGEPLMVLAPPESLGEVADVAVDPVNRRYGVLHRTTGRVEIYDDVGDRIGAFGSTGDGAAQFKSPQGLAATPDGRWVVADGGHGRIEIFDLAGNRVASFGSLGGGAGEFVALDDVAVDADGIIYASDTFQDRIQTFDPDGTPRELLGTFGNGVGEFMTSTGLCTANSFDRLVAASANSSRLQVFRTSSAPPPVTRRPEGVANPTSLTFPAVTVGSAGAPLIVTLGNVGDAPLGIGGVDVSGDFSAAHGCGPFLDPGASCTIDVTFAPTAPGHRSGSIVVDTGEDGGAVVVALDGTAFVPAGVVLSPSSLAFSDQPVGTVSLPRAVALSNTGTVALDVVAIVASNEYLVTDDCPATLAAGAGCTLEVRFAPETFADHVAGSVTVTTTAATSPHAVALDGRGTAARPGISVADAVVVEGDDGDVEAVFEVRLTAATSDTVTVRYATHPDTAREGEDYEAASGTLSFDPGEVSRAVGVTIVPDTLLEPDEETFLFELADAFKGYLEDPLAVGTIRDDERCAGPNRTFNPGAEERSPGPGILGWTSLAEGEWERRAGGPGPDDGRFYFAPGAVELAELAQDVDVSAYAQAIDAGRQRFLFEASVRGIDEIVPDTSRVVVEYRSLDNTFVLESFDSGEIESPLAWTRIVDEHTAPAGTGWIRVRLIARRYSGTDNDAFFDALSLRSLRAATVAVADAAGFEGDAGTDGEIVFPVTLACPYHREVTIDYATADGTAVAGEDYLDATGTVSIAVGETDLRIAVPLVGDDLDEPHETVRLEVAPAAPDDVVALDPRGTGVIVNDDACPRGVGHWIGLTGPWPVDGLEIGGEWYDLEGIRALMTDLDPAVRTVLVRQLVVTKLNLAVGSDPWILPVVDVAEAHVASNPPHAEPSSSGDPWGGRDLVRVLSAYNDNGCAYDAPPLRDRRSPRRMREWLHRLYLDRYREVPPPIEEPTR